MIWNTIQLALRALSRNLLRSFLTMLGVIIGVTAVIMIVTLGNGASQNITQNVASLGEGLLFLSPGDGDGPMGATVMRPFTLRDAEILAREVRGLEGVSPTTISPTTAVFGNNNWSTSVTGITEDYFPVRNMRLVRGEPFTELQYRSGALRCILGSKVREELFGSANPVGAVIRIGKNACPVVGELESKGQTGFGNNQDDIILAPLKAVQSRLVGSEDVTSISIAVAPWADTETVKENIAEILRPRRNLLPQEEDNFDILDMAEISSVLSDVTGALTLFLGAIAAVSLLVGGIGIMNIMLVSVTERTREIGIRLAIGALEGEVLMQFLVESVILTTLGGTLGVILGLSASYVAANALNFPFVVDPFVVVGAFAFSALIGIIFGFLPARRAASLDPIDALRHE